MPTSLGAHNARVAYARDLLSKKGRREHRAFLFEGPTLLAEAVDAGMEIEALYATRAAYEGTPLARQAESNGIQVFLLDDRTMAKISGVETPTGLLAVAPMRISPLGEVFASPGLVLALAGVGDPGNAGTLLRSAEAFGARAVIFGSRGAEPYHPKVVRAAMGSIFRMTVAVASAAEFGTAAGDWEVTGLETGHEPLAHLAFGEKTVLVVGSERQGLGEWEPLCGRFGSIPMDGKTESLNAACAGSIALYEAAKHMDA